MKTVRIGSGAGYAGDRIEPALELITNGNLDYIMFECLAERTIALAQKEKLHNPDKGYNPLMEYRMERVLPLLKEHPVRIVTNMGAANPISAADKIVEMAVECGLPDIKVAAIVGDDILPVLNRYMSQAIMETGEPLETIKGRIVSANAYIGAREISNAFAKGADIVVTGRVADPSLATGPLMNAFGKSYDDADFLGKTIVAGHLLECGGQVTGGYFADPGYKDVPDLWNLGFPILTFDEEGCITLEKLPETGGKLNRATVTEQLLYEIQNPSEYLTPDVVADFSKVNIAEKGDGTVQVTGGTGRQKTGTLKVSVGYTDGWIGEGEISYGGHNAPARAQLAGEIVRKRLNMIQYPCRELRVDLIGLQSLYKSAEAIPVRGFPAETRLRISAHVETEEQAVVIGNEVEALYTNGPAGGGGARGYAHSVLSVASILIPEEEIHSRIVWKGGIRK